MTQLITFIAIFLFTIFTIFFNIWLVNKRLKNKEQLPLYQIIMFFVFLILVAGLLVSLPLDAFFEVPKVVNGEKVYNPKDNFWEVKQAILSLLGVVISAAIAISATSFLGNAFAGLMIRAISNFKTNDFIRVNEYFGAITERGLLHVEIQTESRGLVTLPNIYMITNPVEVVPRKKRLVAAKVTIGYDVSRHLVAKYLKEAAERAELVDPYVYILDLMDSAVHYQICGFLAESSSFALLTVRSKLHAMILDVFHENRVEVASPSLGIQRDAGATQFLPPEEKRPIIVETGSETSFPEDIIFDKAKKAENLENLKARQAELAETLKEIESELGKTKEEDRKATLTARLERLKSYQAQMQQLIESSEDELKNDS